MSNLFLRSEIYTNENLAAANWEENLFKYCEFLNFTIEGGHVDSDFISCTFSELDWYWGLFNMCNFIDCQFRACIFQGTAFMGSRFIDCSFVNCRFVKDNLGADCDFAETVAYGCSVEGGEGFMLLTSS